MKPHERILAGSLAEQLAKKLKSRGQFADSPVQRVSLHTKKGAPISHKRLPKIPPGIVIEFPSAPGQPRIGYIHVAIREGQITLRNFLLEKSGGKWHVGATWTDRFVIPAQVLVAIHLGQHVPDSFVQQIADMY